MPDTTQDTQIIPSQRHLFDIPEDVAYLNCAYMAPNLKAVTTAGIAGAQLKAAPWTVTAPDFFEPAEHARTLFARMIGATADDIAIVPSASYAIASAANNLPLSTGDEIVTLAGQFPSNVYVWREAAAQADARVVTVQKRQDGWTGSLLDAITSRTAIVAIPHCHWTDGALVDLDAVRARTREVGAALVIDACQSMGALPFDVTRYDPDFIAAPCYKWLLGPYAMGFLYVAPRHHDGTPLEQTWTAREKSEDFARLVNYATGFQPGARRYDMGERAQFHLMPMATAALEQILDWGVNNIAATLAEKTRTLIREAATLGFVAEPESRRAGHYLGLTREAPLPEHLLASLAAANVFVSVRGAAIRVTPHVYTSDTDLERFMTALESGLGASR
ncbi:MAG: aminotransferase class V-fold PLP-dependent enzyme [Candidatus Phaeomarinobacter sp.]